MVIFTSQILKIFKNGERWQRGAINLTNDVTEKLGGKEREILMCILDLDKEYTEEELIGEIKKGYVEFKRYKAAEKLLNKIKSEMTEEWI